MTEMLFLFDGSNCLEGGSEFRGPRREEYYTGDLSIEQSDRINVRSERKAAGPISIIRQTSRNNLHFRRTWRHIREDATDLMVLWFVKCGTMVFSDQRGTFTARPGDLVITRSVSPFATALRPAPT